MTGTHRSRALYQGKFFEGDGLQAVRKVSRPYGTFQRCMPTQDYVLG
jgi:hypothetical protein